MQPSCLEALTFPLPAGASLRLTDEARPHSPGPPIALPDGVSATLSSRLFTAPLPQDRPPFFYDSTAPDRGLNALRIFELRDYLWELECPPHLPDVSITSSLEQSSDSDLWRARKTSGRFRFVNFLGAAWIEVTAAGYPPLRISFEVASPKLDYEQEYRSMVESIGAECQQLLLEWGTPTTINLSSNPAKKAQTLLEQFLFLRHVLGPDRLELYLETIQRNPHTRLESEQSWKPASNANPSLFLRDPLRHGRGWHHSDQRLIPENLREERRFDSLDTPPNRFLQFALHDFRNLCEEILRARLWKPESPVAKEAAALQDSLDAFLARPLFAEVKPLQRLPLESTTLQQREGYREVLQAWLMLDAAAQIDWPGRSDAYKGTSRNVATLYEYWLFFLLVRAFRDQLQMIPQIDPFTDTGGGLPLCCRASDGRLLIHLKQHETSFCRFLWSPDGHQKLAIHFFYNRSFSPQSVGHRGSYSKTFRPDYSLVIIPEHFSSPDWLAAETAAEAAGRIAYLHFDAKYRGENLPGIFGATEDQPDDPVAEGRAKASGIAKNADLYKMHTYNEAIRRTVGSYVLYPGIAPDPQNPQSANARFHRYHEIIPGIGAFALRPRQDHLPPEGLPALLSFLHDLLTHHLNHFSQSARIDYWKESILRENPLDYLPTTIPNSISNSPKTPNSPNSPISPSSPKSPSNLTPPHTPQLGPHHPQDTPLLLGFVRSPDDAATCRQTLTFFCHAVEWSNTLPREPGLASPLDFDPFRAHFFTPYHQNHSADWIAKISEVKLVTAAERAKEIGQPLSSMRAAYYYRFQLTDPQPLTPRQVHPLIKKRPGKPLACTYSQFAHCPPIPSPLPSTPSTPTPHSPHSPQLDP